MEDVMKEMGLEMVYARIIYEPLNQRQEVFCRTKKELLEMVNMLTVNRIWFDVDFPEMEMPKNQIKTTKKS